MKTKNRALYLLGVIFLVSSVLVSGCAGGGKKENKEPLFAEPITFSIMTYEHPSQPLNPNSLKFQAIQEATNVTLDFDITPNSEYNTKKSAAIASGIVNDLTSVVQTDLNSYARSGLFMDLTDYLETELSNFYSYVKDDQGWKNTLIDGRSFGCTILTAATNSLGGFMPVMRTDILQKNNLSIPATWDEWFTVMKQLKTIYPNSTPFSGRNKGANLLYQASYSMGRVPDLYYDFESGQYQYGALTPEYKEVLEFWVKCYEEGILDQNWMMVDSNTWEEGVVNGNIFFWYDNSGFSISQTQELQKSDPNAAMQVINLLANSKGKKQGLLYSPNSYESYWALSAAAEKPAELRKFMNWLYSEEGMYIANYGKEGESFTLDDDKTVAIPQEITSKYAGNANANYNWMSDYGLGLLSFTPLVHTKYDMNTQLGLIDQDTQAMIRKELDAGEYQFQFVNVTLPDEITVDIRNKISICNALIYSGVRDFVTGDRPITEYNDWVTSLRDNGAEDILNAYNEALTKAVK